MTSDPSPPLKNSANLGDLEKWPKLHWESIALIPSPVAAPMGVAQLLSLRGILPLPHSSEEIV